MPNQQKREFTVRADSESVFEGSTPRHAALKAARELSETVPTTSEAEARTETNEIRLKERDSAKVHVYEAWAWEDEVPDDHPSWMGDTVIEANVSKKGIEFE